MLKRIVPALALVASLSVLQPAAVRADVPFNPQSTFLSLIPDLVCNPYTESCITYTQSTMLGGNANAAIGDQMGNMASVNLQQNTGSAISASQDMYNLTAAVSQLNSLYPSRQGTAIATKLAQAANNYSAVNTVAGEMLNEPGALGGQAAQQDAFEQLASEQHQALQLQATQTLQQESDVVNADQTQMEALDLGGPPETGWLL